MKAFFNADPHPRDTAWSHPSLWRRSCPETVIGADEHSQIGILTPDYKPRSRLPMQTPPSVALAEPAQWHIGSLSSVTVAQPSPISTGFPVIWLRIWATYQAARSVKERKSITTRAESCKLNIHLAWGPESSVNWIVAYGCTCPMQNETSHSANTRLTRRFTQ